MKDFDPTHIDALYAKVKAGGSQSAGYALALFKTVFQPGEAAPAACILRLAEVKARTGLSRSTIYQHIANGSFPQPVQLGARAVGWRESAINEWLQSRNSR